MRRSRSAGDCSPRTAVASQASVRMATQRAARSSRAAAARSKVSPAQLSPVATNAWRIRARTASSQIPASFWPMPTHGRACLTGATTSPSVTAATTATTPAPMMIGVRRAQGSRSSSAMSASMEG